ncbi:MAG TPA: hypothetical protein VHK90_06850 [Thermoanaerobaculia bacterium]|nr:hypothetical protein [Thermoanaerobaculia bacterium]
MTDFLRACHLGGEELRATIDVVLLPGPPAVRMFLVAAQDLAGIVSDRPVGFLLATGQELDGGDALVRRAVQVEVPIAIRRREFFDDVQAVINECPAVIADQVSREVIARTG